MAPILLSVEPMKNLTAPCWPLAAFNLNGQMLKSLGGLLFAFTLAAPVFSADIEGRYERGVRVKNLETGVEVGAVNFIEIERRAGGIFFVYESWHANGHVCRLWGRAKDSKEGGGYDYSESGPTSKAKSCRALIAVTDQHVVLGDLGGYCRVDHCGARGEIGKDHFLLKNRTPLRASVRVPW
jgi:hypothetical protein